MELMTLDELVARAAQALLSAGLDQPSARITELPTARTVRFYATHGLVDKPSGYRGRTALYGARHLAQIVAIKRLQAQGLSLEQIQGQLAGASDEALLASAGSLTPAPAPAYSPEAARSPARRAADFWRDEPASSSASSPATQGWHEPSPAPAPTTAPARDATARRATGGAWPLCGARLAPGVSLIIEGVARQLTPQELAELSQASAPLLDALRALELIP